MINFVSFQGMVHTIKDFPTGPSSDETGCTKMFSIVDEQGRVVNFIVSPTTYFVEQAQVMAGDIVMGYYDGSAPAVLIYPPQYSALIMVRNTAYPNVKVDFFNQQLTSSDGRLTLKLSANTPILLRNGQPFSNNPINRNLIVLYGPTTRSIPAQTSPFKIIVWC